MFAPTFGDVVRRDLTTNGPNEKWATGITGLSTAQGKPCVGALWDLWSCRIVGRAIDERMKACLIVTAIGVVVARCDDVACRIMDADRDNQFRAREIHHALVRHRMVGSMG